MPKTTPTQYLTDERIQSVKQYLEDVKNGVDTVTAWKAHKRRTQEAEAK